MAPATLIFNLIFDVTIQVVLLTTVIIDSYILWTSTRARVSAAATLVFDALCFHCCTRIVKPSVALAVLFHTLVQASLIIYDNPVKSFFIFVITALCWNVAVGPPTSREENRIRRNPRIGRGSPNRRTTALLGSGGRFNNLPNDLESQSLTRLMVEALRLERERARLDIVDSVLEKILEVLNEERNDDWEILNQMFAEDMDL